MDREGIRQRCPLSPVLFNLFIIADLEEEMRKKCWGGIRVGGERIYTLAYADDVVMMAEDEGRMRSWKDLRDIWGKRGWI